MVQAEIGRNVLAHPGDGEPVGGDVGDHREHRHEPQQLVAPAQDAREVTERPGAERLEQVEAEGDEGR